MTGSELRSPPAADDTAALRRRLGEFDWYHTQELAPGVETPGLFDHRPYVDRYGIPADLSGKRVLEVGTFEGFWAFELERRGAEVIAIDVDRMQQLDWPPRLRPSEDGPGARASRSPRRRSEATSNGSGFPSTTRRPSGWAASSTSFSSARC
jgi:hypothetical protein